LERRLAPAGDHLLWIASLLGLLGAARVSGAGWSRLRDYALERGWDERLQRQGQQLTRNARFAGAVARDVRQLQPLLRQQRQGIEDK
jgi:hypothetical protein